MIEQFYSQRFNSPNFALGKKKKTLHEVRWQLNCLCWGGLLTAVIGKCDRERGMPPRKTRTPFNYSGALCIIFEGKCIAAFNCLKLKWNLKNVISPLCFFCFYRAELDGGKRSVLFRCVISYFPRAVTTWTEAVPGVL